MKNKLLLPFKIGDGLIQKFKFFFVIFILFFEHKLKIKYKAFYSVKLRFNDKSFLFYPTDGSDIGIMHEVFINKEYLIKIKDPKNVVDIGSNVGVSVIFFKLLYPDSNIYAFEPDPATFEKLKRNISQFNKVFLYNWAISNINSDIDYYVNTESSMSSSMYKRSSFQKQIKVKSITISNLIKELNLSRIDLLKFDIEGAEFVAFDNKDNTKDIEYLIGEVHEDIANKDINSFLELFSDYEVLRKELILPKRYIVELKHI
jgi:FkbM family methyltransferase